MTDHEAAENVEAALVVAQKIYDLLRDCIVPHVAMPALALVSGTVLANIKLEEGMDMDELMQEWVDGMKAQYEHVVEEMKKGTN